ncbi:MAG: hypothetical protein Q7J57_15195 [Gemmobacter sp.]|nr:hypothetical protein [Gemmobacter sp.]
MGALVRALLVMVLIATPSLLLPSVSADAKQMVALVSLFLGALVLVEYTSTYPSLVEFRHAPPFNRMRFLMLFITVFLLSVIVRGKTDPTNLTALVEAVGTLIGRAIDFPYSPVRLVVLMLPDDMLAEHVSVIRTAAGISYLTSLLTLAVFVILIRTGSWPGRVSAFNVWLNLPTFDPTAGGDVVDRLERDARVNIALGFLLPFLIPAVIKAATSGIAPITLSAPHMMIWTMAAWSFLPASLFMRGIAMGHVAEMIREKRRQSGNTAEGRLATA